MFSVQKFATAAPLPILEIRVASPFIPEQASEIEASQKLLYKIYVEQAGWLPENDPTNIRVEYSSNNRSPKLVNDYDAVGMRFNAYIDGELVGTIRLAGTVNGMFELEHYTPLPKEVLNLGHNNRNYIWEVNRLAVSEEFRQLKYLLVSGLGTENEKPHGFKTVFEALINEVKTYTDILGGVFFAAPNAALARPLKNMDLETSQIPKFKYHPNDPNYVRHVYFLTPMRPIGDGFSSIAISAQYHQESQKPPGLVIQNCRNLFNKSWKTPYH